MSRITLCCSHVVGVLVVAIPLIANATPPGPQGASTGDGSTPFTGLALAPEANLFVGAASVSVPIEVPPGRGGLTPSLALVYNSSARRSPYGYGWDLPLGTIQRCLKHGVPSCGDPTYRNEFVLTLPTGAVECTLEADNHCRPKVDESFLRIEYVGSDNHWEVWDRDGRKYTFGGVVSARTGSDTSSLFQPEILGQPYVPCTYTFSWALTRVEDTNGNFLTVAYSSVKNLLYPLVISYGGNSIGGLAPIFAVHFLWEPYTSGGPTQAIAGFPAEISRRLRHIETRYEGTLVRRYELTYDPLLTSDRELQFLRDVKLVSNAGPLLNVAGQPARTTFLYRRDEPAAYFQLPRTSPSFLPDQPSRFRIEIQGSIYDDTVRDVFDVNGDALPDIVDVDGCDNPWSVYLGSPAGFDTTPRSWSHPGCMFIRTRYTNIEKHDVAQETVDLNGDAIPDYVDAQSECPDLQCDYTTWKVYLGYVNGDGSGGFDDVPLAWAKPPELEDGYVRRTRAHAQGTNLAGWNAPVVSYRELIDMNADGLPDLVSIRDSFP